MSLKSETVRTEATVKPEPDQEYEPEVGETGTVGTYIPANPDQNDEYEPEVTSASSTYTPALSILTKNYVNIYTESEEKAESDSDSGSDFEFVPLPEEVKIKNNLTEEEKQNCNSGAFAKHDLAPGALPKVPDVSGIVVPPSLRVEELGKIDKVIENPMLLLIIESRIGKNYLLQYPCKAYHLKILKNREKVDSRGQGCAKGPFLGFKSFSLQFKNKRQS